MGEGAAVLMRHGEASVRIEDVANGRRRVTVEAPPEVFVSRRSWESAYPIDLIERILEVKGPSYLCDELAREEDPKYTELFLRYGLLGFVPEREFTAAGMLDFGSGSGASTVTMAR